MVRIALWLALSFVALAQDYRAERTTDHGVPVVRLTDSTNGVEVAIVPSVGSASYELPAASGARVSGSAPAASKARQPA